MSSAISSPTNLSDLTKYSKYTDGIGKEGDSVSTNASSASCERNRDFIFNNVKQYLTGPKRVFEVGTGTGDHAVYFCQKLPNITWQTSDRRAYHELIHKKLEEAKLPKETLKSPVAFDIDVDVINDRYDVILAFNVVHCIPMKSTEQLFKKASTALKVNGLFILYGPYNLHGTFTSVGNKNFNAKLQKQDKRLGLKDIDDVTKLAQKYGLTPPELVLHQQANNYLLLFTKSPENGMNLNDSRLIAKL